MYIDSYKFNTVWRIEGSGVWYLQSVQFRSVLLVCTTSGLADVEEEGASSKHKTKTLTDGPRRDMVGRETAHMRTRCLYKLEESWVETQDEQQYINHFNM